MMAVRKLVWTDRGVTIHDPSPINAETVELRGAAKGVWMRAVVRKRQGNKDVREEVEVRKEKGKEAQEKRKEVSAVGAASRN